MVLKDIQFLKHGFIFHRKRAFVSAQLFFKHYKREGSWQLDRPGGRKVEEKGRRLLEKIGKNQLIFFNAACGYG